MVLPGHALMLFWLCTGSSFCCGQLRAQNCPGGVFKLSPVQDAIVLARTLRDTLGGPGAPGLKQHTLVKVDEALRDFERERTRRKLKISVKSNLMGAALQIPFAPVSDLKNSQTCSRVCCSMVCKNTMGCCVVALVITMFALHQ